MKIGKVIYNGISSDTLGVFVSGKGTFDPAELDTTSYQIPGRNGDLILQNNRYKNIKVKYPAFVPNDFENRVQSVRNWLRSSKIYARLEDNYDQTHFRMGLGRNVTFTPAFLNMGANASFEFDCKPQRFLKTGEDPFDVGVWGETTEESGSIVNFEAEADTGIKKASVAMLPQQTGTPWIDSTPSTEPYIKKAYSGGGNREADKIVGATVAWNQTVINLTPVQGWGYDPNRNSFSVSNDVATLVKFAGVGDGVGYVRPTYTNADFIKGHIYFATIDVKGAAGTKVTLFSNSYTSGGKDLTISTADVWTNVTNTFLFNASTQPVVRRCVWIRGNSENDVTVQFRNFMFIDLTAMFGSSIADYIYTLESGTAGAGVAWLKSYGFITEDYYAYDPGSLQSVNVSAHKTVGFNQWDEEWEQGGLADGNPTTDSSRIRSKNYMPCFPSTAYYKYCVKGNYINIFWYDSNKTYISYNTASGGNLITSPTNAHFFKICTTTTYGGMYTNDICVNISDPNKNGTYEPYTAHTYALDSDLILRGLFKLDANNNLYADGDEYPFSGSVSRGWKEIEVTSCGSVATASTGVQCATISLTDTAIAEASSNGFLSTKYAFRTNAPSDSGWFRIFGVNLFIYDSRFSDKATADSILASEKPHFLYKLATANTESADPYTASQEVVSGGTEEYTDYGVSQGTRDVAIPVGHSTIYSLSVPITGYTQAKLTRTGRNLTSVSSGTNVVVGKALQGKTYTFSVTVTGNDVGVNIRKNTQDGDVVVNKTLSAPRDSVTFTADEDFDIFVNGFSGFSSRASEFQLEIGSTSSPYEAYNGSATTVTFTDQGTVYGGTLDFVSGVLKLTWKIDDLGNKTYTHSVSNNRHFFTTDFSDRLKIANAEYLHAMSTLYSPEKQNATWTNGIMASVGASSTSITFVNNGYSDATTFKSAMTGEKLVYELATPITYQLTPQQIQTLLGQNYLWSDSGDITVEYGEDPNKLLNPTQYEARPVIKVTNPTQGGTITANGTTLTCLTAYTGEVIIDCEAMNIYSGANNLNSYFSGDFPVLSGGVNAVSFTGADSVEIIPRWWEL